MTTENTENTVAKLERDIKGFKATVELGNALEKLRSNREFNKLITEGYLKDEAIRLVHAKGLPNMQKDEHQDAIVRDINAIGSLVQYFNTISQQASIAAKQMRDAELEREEVLRGEG